MTEHVDENDIFVVEYTEFDVVEPIIFELEKRWFGCFAHTLQLVVRDAMKEMEFYPRLSKTYSKVAKISKLYNQPSHFRYDLKFTIPRNNETRWNSEYPLLNAVLTKRQSINEVLVRHHHEEFVIADVENDMLTELKNILGLFDQATVIFQTDSQASLPRVIPTLQQLERAMISLESGHASISAVREKLLNGLQSRFEFVHCNGLFAIASTLHPNLKLSFTGTERSSRNFVRSRRSVAVGMKLL